MERGGGGSEKMAMRQQWMNRSERWKQEIRKGGKNCSAMVEICRKIINSGGFPGRKQQQQQFPGRECVERAIVGLREASI